MHAKQQKDVIKSSKTYSLRRSYCSHAQLTFSSLRHCSSLAAELLERRRLLQEGFGLREYTEVTGGAKGRGQWQCRDACCSKRQASLTQRTRKLLWWVYPPHTSECSRAAPICTSSKQNYGTCVGICRTLLRWVCPPHTSECSGVTCSTKPEGPTDTTNKISLRSSSCFSR